MVENTQYLEHVYSFMEIFFEDVDIIFDIDPQVGKIFIISNNQHEEATKKSLRDGIQKLLKRRPKSEEMTPVRIPIPIQGERKTIFLLPWKKKGDSAPKYLGVIVGGVEKETLEGFLARNIRKKLEREGPFKSISETRQLNKQLQKFQEYSKKLAELNARTKRENVKLNQELKTVKQDKEFTEENYHKLLNLIEQLEHERDECHGLNEMVIEENSKLIEQLGEVGTIIAKVTEFENEKEGYVRLLQEKDRAANETRVDKVSKEGILNKLKLLILEIREDGRIYFCNSSVEKFYEDTFGKDGVVSNNYHKILKSDQFPKIEAAITDAINSGQETTVDVNLHKANPKTYKTEKILFKMYSFPLKRDQGRENAAGVLFWQL